MNRTKYINQHWSEFEKFIGAAYAKGASELRDYAPDVTWCNALAKLVEAETANERQHRRGNDRRPKDFSAPIAAKLIIMRQAAVGSQKKDCPPASDFLVYRQTTVEAQVIGWLCRWVIDDPWRAAVDVIDYVAVMQEADAA